MTAEQGGDPVGGQEPVAPRRDDGGGAAPSEAAERRARLGSRVLAATDLARIVPLAGTFNFRDAGGYPTADGGRIRPGRLYRADALGNLDDAGRETLHELGVGTVVDLREDLESDTTPDAVEGLGLRRLHIPIFDNRLYPSAARSESPGSDRPSRTLERLYTTMIEQFGDKVAEAVAVLAEEGQGPVVVHCSAGKDRTGVVVALALSAAGVDDEWVVDDYAASESFLSGEFLAALQTNFAKAGIVQNIAHTATQSPPYLMRDVLAQIREGHGSVAGYLRAHGLDDAQLARLRENLVAPAGGPA